MAKTKKETEWIGRTPKELKRELGMADSERLQWDEFLYCMGYPIEVIEGMESVRKSKHFKKMAEIRKHNRKLYIGKYGKSAPEKK